MKTILEISYSFLTTLFLLVTFCSCEQSSPSESSLNTLSENTKSVEANSIEGGWYLISGEYSGVKREEGQPFQFKLFGDKYFSLLMKGDNEDWNSAATGTYDLKGDIYMEKFEFCSKLKFEHAYGEWKYQLIGDTLIMEGPIKVIDGKGIESPELMGGYNSMREIRIRAR
ncbi:MAG: hypothetical protein IPL46_18330 [Saprospiraceae bacterium]|nr:hypothetical protein [Saprospiraceae bacterium]